MDSLTPQLPSQRPNPDDPGADSWALVERAQAGDTEAFAEIYHRYLDPVFRFVYYRVTTRAVAEDLAHEVFLRALKGIGSFTWQGRDIGAWLITIARHLVADHFKSARYRFEYPTAEVLGADEADKPELAPEAMVVAYLENRELIAAVLALPAEQRECIVLRFLRGLSVAETGAIMGRNDGAIKALQFRAVRALARNQALLARVGVR